MLAIKWHKSDYKNWIDLIPEDWLEFEGEHTDLRYFCEKSHKRLDCKVNVSVTSRSALIDYGGPHREWNAEHDIDPGAMRIDFTNEGRTEIGSIWWAEDRVNFEEAEAKWLPSFDYEVAEGNTKLVTHLRRERNPWLADAKKQQVIQQSGKLTCEACDFEFASMYGDLGKDFCEVHHINPLKRGPRTVTIDDLAILCSNCHRMIHRTSPIETITQFKRRFV